MSLIIVTGAGGEPEYEEAFAGWIENWQKAAAAGNAKCTTIGLAAPEADSLARLRTALEAEPADGAIPLWIVLLGHGSADSADAKFNLRGDDLAAPELANLLKRFARPVVVIGTFSASGAFLGPLAAPNRVVLTATKGGAENNFSRLGQHLSASIADLTADVDHDGQTSLLEAWLAAAQRTADFYKSEGRLATEHSLLDDNGDGRGTPADWFRGTRAVKKAADSASADGTRAHGMHLVATRAEQNLAPELLTRRTALETELAALREQKGALAEDDYFTKLEAVLLELARLRREINGAKR